MRLTERLDFGHAVSGTCPLCLCPTAETLCGYTTLGWFCDLLSEPRHKGDPMREVMAFDNAATVECLSCHVRITVSTSNPILVPAVTGCPICGANLHNWQWEISGEGRTAESSTSLE